ncbi:hypothetical protein RND81_04G104600 [Saponaria officinalis]|uniref:Uncharacterized protein n=1 Tax=Saponaria officinalis TaxID=3572 RepID=A0AAW1LE22_SAPOF
MTHNATRQSITLFHINFTFSNTIPPFLFHLPNSATPTLHPLFKSFISTSDHHHLPISDHHSPLRPALAGRHSHPALLPHLLSSATTPLAPATPSSFPTSIPSAPVIIAH